LRALIVILLVLSVAALVMELKLFGQREELKGRNQKLASGVIRLAETIEAPASTNADLVAKDAPHVKLTDDQLKKYYGVDAAGKKTTQGPGTLDDLLTDLAGKASVQFSRLNDTRDALDQNRTKLTQTADTLKQTEETLTSTKKDLKDNQDLVASQKTELEQKKESLAQLQEQKDAADTKVEKQTAEITKLSEKLTDENSKLKATQDYAKKLEKQLAVMRYGGAGNEGGSNAPPPGIQGQIVVVDTNWNFVVVDMLPDGHLYPMTDLMVQRDSKLVGKVRVSEVRSEQSLAVGEVLTDWQQLPVAAGDYVFY
jgi:chromosome segregation ATPase